MLTFLPPQHHGQQTYIYDKLSLHMPHLTLNSTTFQTHTCSACSALGRTDSLLHSYSLRGERAVETVKWQWMTHLVYAAGNFAAISTTQEDCWHSCSLASSRNDTFHGCHKITCCSSKYVSNQLLNTNATQYINSFLCMKWFITLQLGFSFPKPSLHTTQSHCFIHINVKVALLHTNTSLIWHRQNKTVLWLNELLSTKINSRSWHYNVWFSVKARTVPT